MEKCANEFFLPEDIIQLIQSYLTAKEAARTSIVSKSWHAAWSTRPGLDFEERDFSWQRWGRDAEDMFWQFVKKTTQRYGELNLRIQSIRLWMSFGRVNVSHAEELIAEESIVSALKLGATDVNFSADCYMVLPLVTLGSETLRKLSARNCKIGLGEDRKARCSRLESLSLDNVMCADGDIIWDIILSCPLIENLSLSDCIFGNGNAAFRQSRPFEKLSGSAVNGFISPFNKLKSLFVGNVHIDASFFCDFGSKFPCLKDLSVHYCDGYHGLIKIASISLECMSFVQKLMLRARFDVPCIRKFMYEGTSVPSLSFEKYSRGWKSDISVTINRHCASWFPRLKKLLTNLSQDEICLSLKILTFTDKSSDNGRDDDLPPVAVKDLMLDLEVPSSITSSFLNGLFWSCRPKFITLHFPRFGEGVSHSFLLRLCKTLTNELSEANTVEVFDEGPAEWRPAPLKTLLKASISPKCKRKLRFQLR